MNEKHDAIMEIARQAERSLLDAGATPEEAESVLNAIARIAGAYLPPVRGKFNINLDDAKVN